MHVHSARLPTLQYSSERRQRAVGRDDREVAAVLHDYFPEASAPPARGWRRSAEHHAGLGGGQPGFVEVQLNGGRSNEV
jgi:hypothetical protein